MIAVVVVVVVLYCSNLNTFYVVIGLVWFGFLYSALSSGYTRGSQFRSISSFLLLLLQVEAWQQSERLIGFGSQPLMTKSIGCSQMRQLTFM